MLRKLPSRAPYGAVRVLRGLSGEGIAAKRRPWAAVKNDETIEIFAVISSFLPGPP